MSKQANPIDEAVGNRLRLRCMEIGMSQTQLGKTLGITHQQVNKYETGENSISVGRLEQIAAVLKVPVPFFFEGVPTIAADAPLSGLMGFVATAEGVALIKAFTAIANAKLRRRIVALVEEIAGPVAVAQTAIRGPLTKFRLASSS